MIHKIVGVVIAYLVTPVRAHLDDPLHMHLQDHMHEHMEPRIWEHADNFTAHFIEDLTGDHREHLQGFKGTMDAGEHEVGCDKCKCKKCIMKGSKFIMEMVVKRIKKVCSWKDESEWVKEGYEHGHMKEWFCKAFKAHPKVVLGYIAVKVRPVSMSMAWCSGAGYCHKHHKAKEIMFGDDMMEDDLVINKDDEELNHPYIEPQLHPQWAKGFQMHNFHLDEKIIQQMKDEQEKKHHSKEEPDGVVSLISRRLTQFFDINEDVVVIKDEEHDNDYNNVIMDISKDSEMMKHMCSHCFMRTTKFVMEMAIKKTIMMCKKTKCPFLQKMCGFAKNHKAFAFGGLLAMVQPEKYAIGRCWKKKENHHPVMERVKSLIDPVMHFFGPPPQIEFMEIHDIPLEVEKGHEKVISNIHDMMNKLFATDIKEEENNNAIRVFP